MAALLLLIDLQSAAGLLAAPAQDGGRITSGSADGAMGNRGVAAGTIREAVVAASERTGRASAAVPVADAARDALRFNSVFPFVHDSITEAGFAGHPVSRSMLRLVQHANRQQDFASVKVLAAIASFGKRLVPSADYRFDEHFDRPAHLTHAEAYTAAIAVVRRSTAATVELIGAREYEAAARLLGSLLHTWQDFASHSNVALLASSPDDPLYDRLLEPDGMPAGLKVTSFDRHADDPERPRDPLAYTHADFALDHAGKNDFARGVPGGATRTRYELAVETATALTRRSIDGIARSVADLYSADAWSAFLAHDARRTTGAWSYAAIVEASRAHAGIRVGRRLTRIVPALEAGLGLFSDGHVQVGVLIGIDALGPRVRGFVTLEYTATGRGLSWGGGVDLRVIDGAWTPDIRIAGDSDRGLLLGLSGRL
jgi:hypothetical protein